MITYLLARLVAGQKTCVAFANSNLLVHAAHDPNVLNSLTDMLVLNDGVAVDLASRALYGSNFPENLNGTDLTPALLDALPSGTRVFLYGARPHVVAQLADRISVERSNIVVCGWRDGYSPSHALSDAINLSKADVVLVALGNPRQELWIGAARHAVSASLLLGVGAYFDFATGHVPRAPSLMRALRTEWLFRLALEPRRLWRRYTVDTARFFYLICKQAVLQRRKQQPTS